MNLKNYICFRVLCVWVWVWACVCVCFNTIYHLKSVVLLLLLLLFFLVVVSLFQSSISSSANSLSFKKKKSLFFSLSLLLSLALSSNLIIYKNIIISILFQKINIYIYILISALPLHAFQRECMCAYFVFIAIIFRNLSICSIFSHSFDLHSKF